MSQGSKRSYQSASQVGLGEMLSKKHSDQKAANKELFLRILQNLRFLTRQGLALRGTHGEEVHSNFMQLFIFLVKIANPAATA